MCVGGGREEGREGGREVCIGRGREGVGKEKGREEGRVGGREGGGCVERGHVSVTSGTVYVTWQFVFYSFDVVKVIHDKLLDQIGSSK